MVDSELEALMQKEIEELDEKIKQNQKEYRELRKEYENKKRAMRNWLRPPIRPRRAKKKTLNETRVVPVQAERKFESSTETP